MGYELSPKANFRMKLTVLEKNEDGSMKVVGEKWIKGSRREFMDSLREDRENGTVRTIEVVDQKPENFKLNQIYMLRSRDVVWVYMEK